MLKRISDQSIFFHFFVYVVFVLVVVFRLRYRGEFRFFVYVVFILVGVFRLRYRGEFRLTLQHSSRGGNNVSVFR